MKNHIISLLKEKKIDCLEPIDLQNGNTGFLIYSAENNELEKYFSKETLEKRRLYKQCREINEAYLYRYYYFQEIKGQTGEHITIIMMNPSFANSKSSDPTINTINKYLKCKKYCSFDIINLYPVRTPLPRDLEICKAKIDSHILENYKKNFLKSFLSKCENKIVVAWGQSFHQEAERLFNELGYDYKNFYAYALNKDGSPTHFSPCAFNRAKKLEDFELIKDIC